MPLSPPAPREMLHRREIDIRGWRRDDGLYDIEAYLLDTKAYPFENDDRGTIQPGEPLHGLWLRLTVREDMEIVAAEAASDHTPYAVCPPPRRISPASPGLRSAPASTARWPSGSAAAMAAPICGRCWGRWRRSPSRPSTRSARSGSGRRRRGSSPAAARCRGAGRRCWAAASPMRRTAR